MNGILSRGFFGGATVAQTARYETFLTRAHALGLPHGQARTIFRDEAETGCGFHAAITRAEHRLSQFYEYGYLPLILRDVLTRDEINALPFSSEMILNSWRWMPRPLGQQFAEMNHGRRRTVVEAAVELTAQLGGDAEGWPLERAMAVVMPDTEDA